jgi:hypothetical protein
MLNKSYFLNKRSLGKTFQKQGESTTNVDGHISRTFGNDFGSSYEFYATVKMLLILSFALNMFFLFLESFVSTLPNTVDEENPMLPCEFCEGMIPMRKLLEHQVSKRKNEIEKPKLTNYILT